MFEKLQSEWRDCIALGYNEYFAYPERFRDLVLLVINWVGEAAERIGLVDLGHRIWDNEVWDDSRRKRYPSFSIIQPLDLLKTRRKIRLG